MAVSTTKASQPESCSLSGDHPVCRHSISGLLPCAVPPALHQCLYTCLHLNAGHLRRYRWQVVGPPSPWQHSTVILYSYQTRLLSSTFTHLSESISDLAQHAIKLITNSILSVAPRYSGSQAWFKSSFAFRVIPPPKTPHHSPSFCQR
jgi:hypothetical protein